MTQRKRARSKKEDGDLKDFFSNCNFGKKNASSGSGFFKKSQKPKLEKLEFKKKHQLSFGGVLTRLSRELQANEVEEHRNVSCYYYNNFCVNFAYRKRML
jgi:hypothetical protein